MKKWTKDLKKLEKMIKSHIQWAIPIKTISKKINIPK